MGHLEEDLNNNINPGTYSFLPLDIFTLPYLFLNGVLVCMFSLLNRGCILLTVVQQVKLLNQHLNKRDDWPAEATVFLIRSSIGYILWSHRCKQVAE